MVRARHFHGRESGNEGLKRPKSLKKDSTAKDGWGSTSFKILGSVVVAVVAYLAYKGYCETRVTTPLNAGKAVQKSGLDVPERFWGSYRPGVYFGMKTRAPADLLTGLMWMIPEYISPNNVGLRHWCEQGDNLDKYGWIKHDGEKFGLQEIYDRGVKLTTSFVKRWTDQSKPKGGSWTARIKAELTNAEKKKPEIFTFFYYVSLDEGAVGDIEPLFKDPSDPRRLTGVSGQTSNLGNFQLDFVVDEKTMASKPQFFFTSVHSPKPDQYTNIIMNKLKLYQEGGESKGKEQRPHIIGLESMIDTKSGQPNFIAIQINSKIPFQCDVVFRSQSDYSLQGEEYSLVLAKHISNFNSRFEQTFHLQEKGFDEKAVHFAQSAMSNMVGGIGYFYGHSIVKSELLKEPTAYWNAGLYTAVPSRSFFPRGFLWDEGFHNLLISKWNPEISADIIAHWLDLMNSEGWIPREQILGSEARAKVPDEFVVQSNQNANPPTLLLTLHSMLKDLANEDWLRESLTRMWPRLVAWYSWFVRTQAGPVPGTFRWRGRQASIEELNPKTLTSGLDDFPRASHPTEDERHVDLRCWMALASSLMADIGHIIGRTQEAAEYGQQSEFLHNNQLLDDAHWSNEHGAYLDYGFHTDAVILQKPPYDPDLPPNKQITGKVRKVLREPTLQYVNQVGYVSLFPLILEVLHGSSSNIPKVLEALEDPDRMHTPYGLRSLSKNATMYNKYNTQHDAPYWRGPIWLNINFLTLRALHNLSQNQDTQENIRSQASRIYIKLRKNLIDNIIKEYTRTGYIWEQYDDKTGKGKGCKPFTGWSALVVLLMSENY